MSRYTTASSRPPSFGQDDFDDTPMSGVSFFLISMVVFLAIAGAAIFFGTQAIEDTIEQDSLQALAAAEFPEVSVEVAGVDVTLNGRYLEGQDPDQAFAAVEGVNGVGDVDGQIWPIATEELGEAAEKGATLEASWTESELVVTGTVTTEERVVFIQDELTAKLATEDPDDPEGAPARLTNVDTSGVRLDETLLDESEWFGNALALLVTTVQQIPEGSFKADWSTSYLAISGNTEDEEVQDELHARLAEVAAFGFTNPIPGIIVPRTGPTKEEVEAVQEELNEVILDQVVEFEIDSFDLTENGRNLLDEVAATLADAPEVLVLIEGHTDDRGSDEENMILSENRANAVLEYLVAKGLARERFTAIGYGETQPVESNNTADGRARNRRIEFTAQFDNVQGEEDG